MATELKRELSRVIPVEGLSEEDVYSLMTAPPDLKMGDLTLPCFRLAKTLRKSPQVIAADLCAAVKDRLPEGVASVEAVNGYLNFRFDKASEAARVIKKVLSDGASYGSDTIGKGKTVCIDYSSINIAKPFHIGHLLTTVIGGSLYKILEKLGYKCVGINHLGDWGTQFGKLIVAYKKWCSEEELRKEGMKVLTKIYVRFHEEAEKDPTLDDEARAWFKKIEDGDEEATRLFSLFKEITLREVGKTYDRLKIKFDSYAGESFYNDKMEPVLQELEKKGLLVESEGAKVVDLSEYDMPPCLLVKADGATLYATRDLAAAFYRKATYDFDKCLYVVAYQQNLHFKQVFKVLELLGKDWAKDMVHVPFGMVSLEDGAMSTRKGKVVLLEDVLNNAVQKSLDIITAKNPDLEDKERVAETVGVGAVIFFALSNNRIKDMVFSYDKVLNFDGETGPYVQYTTTRCKSLMKKIGRYDEKKADYASLSDEASCAVIADLNKFGEVLKTAAERYEPSYLSRYLIDLCKDFNRFYLNNRILNEPEGVKEARANVVYAVKTVLEEGLRLLGIDAPDKM
ncbi:MAG: arginine--tRNA ligase [Clostridia bacterium]|nr:arginine--tRNA ligase [Clostridia bacterium]